MIRAIILGVRNMVSSIRAKIIETIRKEKLEARNAVEVRKEPEGNLAEHQVGDEAREAPKASGSDSPVKSGQIKVKAKAPAKKAGGNGKKVQQNRKTPKV